MFGPTDAGREKSSDDRLEIKHRALRSRA
jgi:hypothetical protein